jgi:TrmH family RNA methyltransferase
MITSLSNPKVKLACALAKSKTREREKMFAVEGTRLIETALGAGTSPALLFFTEAARRDDARLAQVIEQARGLTTPYSEIYRGLLTREVYAVSEAVMHALAQTETPQGIVAVFPLPELSLPHSLSFVLIADALRDPGNLGTLLRSAWGAGVDAVILAPGMVDAFNDKVVRAAMGAHFYVPIIRADGWGEIERALAGIPRVYLADARGEVSYLAADWSRPVALIVGGEAEGASESARKIATARVSIPLRVGAESLNAAVAGSILLFAANTLYKGNR